MIGRFPSLKLERMVAFESLIEQDYLYVLDYERDVSYYEEQPLTIEYLWQGKTLRYTPDFHAVWAQHHKLVECKPRVRLDIEENQRKFAIAHQWCQENGWTFSVVTDDELRHGPRLANIKLLTRYARLNVAPSMFNQVERYLHISQTPQTLLNVAHLLVPDAPAQGVAILLHLAFHHRIDVPVTTAPISASTQISLATEVTT